MNRIRRYNLGLLFTVLLLVGCATNPTNRWAQGRTTLTTAQDSVLIAHQAGMITDEMLVQIDPVAQAARAALDKAGTFLPDGGDSFQSYMSIFDSMLSRLEQMAIAGEIKLE